MKTDWAEITWLLLFSATAIVGVIHLLPTSHQLSTKDWIEALGGWGAALVAIPSLILLVRQNNFTEEQSRQARSTALMARVEALRHEYKSISDVVRSFNDFDIEGPNIEIAHRDDPNAYATTVIRSIRRFRSFITDTAYETEGLARQNPSEALLEVRDAFLAGLIKVEDFLKDFGDVLEHLTNPGVSEAQMVASLKAYHRKLHSYETRKEAIESARQLQKAVSEQLGISQQELNRLSGLH